MQLDTEQAIRSGKRTRLAGRGTRRFPKEEGLQRPRVVISAIWKDGNAKKSHGIMIAFIDFSKAYIDREKLWKCIEKLGVNGKFLGFVQSLYREHLAGLELGSG